MSRFSWHSALAIGLMIWAGAVRAEEACRLDAAALAALPAELQADWQGEMRQGLVVKAGKPALLPKDDAPQPAQFAAGAAGALMFSDAAAAAPYRLEPVSGADWDFALPGESPLSGAELLEAELAGLACPLGKLAQFRGVLAMSAELELVFHVFVLTPDAMLMVMQVRPADGITQDGLRVVLRFTR